MALTVTLYNVTDNPKKVNKTLGSAVLTLSNNVQPTDPCDILNPSFIITYPSNIGTFNYCTVSSPFNRNYFVTDIAVLTGGRMRISCNVDVLTTYAGSIKECVGTFTRSEDPRDYHIHDNKFPLTGDMKSKSTLFSTIFTATEDRNYLLTVVGGGS